MHQMKALKHVQLATDGAVSAGKTVPGFQVMLNSPDKLKLILTKGVCVLSSGAIRFVNLSAVAFGLLAFLVNYVVIKYLWHKNDRTGSPSFRNSQLVEPHLQTCFRPPPAVGKRNQLGSDTPEISRTGLVDLTTTYYCTSVVSRRVGRSTSL